MGLVSRVKPGLCTSALLALCLGLGEQSVTAQTRARDLGVPFDGTPGPLNAITDIAGVEVGHVTLIEGDGDLRVGDGPVRTGVTVILPRGAASKDPVFAGWFALNGNGEMTGTAWVEESGFLEGPIAITNTHSVGVVRDSVIAWQAQNDLLLQPWSLPIVAETYDGNLNDINGFHVKKEHVFRAIENAKSGAVAEGGVGGGTGMICYGFKGGIGTASRRVDGHTVAALVQANFGSRDQLRIAGVPVGDEIPRDAPQYGGGSIIIVIGTDAPMLPHQLKRLARRASMGIARTGGTSSNGSGDLFIAFSTANAGAARATERRSVDMLPNDQLSPIFSATVESVEEAIVNALVAAETMVGRDGHRVIELPERELQDLLRKYNRISE